jgi:L-gulonolactone oxidase
VREARGTGRRIRVFGSGHSPSDLALSDDTLVVLDGMAAILAIDASVRRITFQGGATLAQIDKALREGGLALPCLGSIAAQTIAGAVATATHGTGIGHGTLSSLVEEATLVTGTGELLRISRNENENWLDGIRCHLGALGVIVELTLSVCDAFNLEIEERPGDLDSVLANLSDLLQSDYYRFWYLPHADRVWEWRANRVQPQPPDTPSAMARAHMWIRERAVGYRAFEFALYAATYEPRLISYVNRAYTRAIFSRPRSSSGPSHEMFTVDYGVFKQKAHTNEWAIPIERTAEALHSLRTLIATRGFRVHLPIEVRFVKGDGVWLSPCYGRDSCYIGVMAYMPYGRDTEYAPFFEAFEAVMLKLGGRPHWAKHFGPQAEALRARYPRWAEFLALRAKLDPDGVFENAYTQRVLGPIGRSTLEVTA